ncbi:MAG: tRNA (adenosine(37)-N6)-threonylcarbamoyltransferase complex ATPase subunit type 1 TsaE [Spirochaetia bacterium]|nr:tRNA (adenosine(37)-N6)-threonylcarbamoyltransferase complex ATPase subunit type 1 TsaE [Spirochaetia bacterium]
MFFSYSENDTIEIGKKLASSLRGGDVISLSGTLGSGKTVFTRGIARGLGIENNITSPTFTLLCEYEGTLNLNHMDLYRISTSEEFEMIGGREIIYSNGVSVIEWAEKISDYLPDKIIRVNISITENSCRKITIDGIEL